MGNVQIKELKRTEEEAVKVTVSWYEVCFLNH